MAENDSPIVIAGVLGIVIHDSSEYYRQYNLGRFMAKCLAFVPEEDLIGIGSIYLFDDRPDRNLRPAKGAYIKEDGATGRAAICLYLNWCLGYTPYLPERSQYKLINRIRDRALLTLFGKGFMAVTLFHEIGHHKYISISPKVYDKAEDIEFDADAYGREIYWNAFPFRSYLYNFFYRLAQFHYRGHKRTDEGGEQR